jgi:hypothetical protein
MGQVVPRPARLPRGHERRAAERQPDARVGRIGQQQVRAGMERPTPAARPCVLLPRQARASHQKVGARSRSGSSRGRRCPRGGKPPRTSDGDSSPAWPRMARRLAFETSLCSPACVPRGLRRGGSHAAVRQATPGAATVGCPARPSPLGSDVPMRGRARSAWEATERVWKLSPGPFPLRPKYSARRYGHLRAALASMGVLALVVCHGYSRFCASPLSVLERLAPRTRGLRATWE